MLGVLLREKFRLEISLSQ